MILVADFTVKLAAEREPNITAVVLPRFVPLMVTFRPPVVGRVAGLTADTAGTAPPARISRRTLLPLSATTRAPVGPTLTSDGVFSAPAVARVPLAEYPVFPFPATV